MASAGGAVLQDPEVLAALHEGLVTIRASLDSGFPQGLGNEEYWTGLETSLVRYLSELELWNPKLGLVEGSGLRLVRAHILDCLAALPYLDPLVKDGFRVADIGTGAGLPGLLLAVVYRKLPVRWVLVEKQQRRVGFLLNASAFLGLKNVEILQSPLGDLPGGSCDIVLTRAFSPITPEHLEDLERILRPDGISFLYKGRRSRVEEEIQSCGAEIRGRAEILGLNVPFLEEERHIVLIRKASAAR